MWNQQRQGLFFSWSVCVCVWKVVEMDSWLVILIFPGTVWKPLGSCRYQSVPWACCCVCRSVLASGCAFSLVLCPPCLCLCVLSSLSGYLDAYTCVSLSSAPPFRCCSIVSCSFVFRLWFLMIHFKKKKTTFFSFPSTLSFLGVTKPSNKAVSWKLPFESRTPNASNQRSRPQRLQHLMFPLKERMTSLWPRCGNWLHLIIRGYGAVTTLWHRGTEETSCQTLFAPLLVVAPRLTSLAAFTGEALKGWGRDQDTRAGFTASLSSREHRGGTSFPEERSDTSELQEEADGIS